MNLWNKLNYLFDRKMKIRTLGILTIIVIGSFAELLGVAIIVPLVNLAVDENFQENFWCKMVIDITGYRERGQIMLILIVATILIYVMKSIYLSWMTSCMYKFSASVRRQMAVKLMKSYLKQPYAYFLKKNTSELIRSVNIDTGQLYEIVSNVFLIVSNGFTIVILMVALVISNAAMAFLIAGLLAACAIVILLLVQKKTRYYGKKNQQLSGHLIKYLQQTFEGVKEIKVLNNEDYFIDQYSNTYQEQTEVLRKFSLVKVIPKYLIETVCISGILAYLGFNVICNPNYMDIVPQLVMFVTAAYKLLPSANALYAYMNTIIYHKAAIDLVYQDIKEADELNEMIDISENREEQIVFEESITVSHVDFCYENVDNYVLKDAEVEIPKGKSVAFVGPSGGGKTTTADIVLGLLTPIQGKVLVDGKNIAENISAWRRKIGYIPQTIYLTDDSIKCNIALGIPKGEIDEDRVWKALEEAQLADFVKGLEKGIETEVGERGTRISGGQRQRIGIARALYHDPEILVFDEATSALDNDTEKEVMKAIDSLHGNKTMVMIAHRLSTIENCDMVYRIEQAKITRER